MDAAEMSGGGGGGGGDLAKPIRLDTTVSKKDRLKLKKQSLEAAMMQFQQTIELLSGMECIDGDEEDVNAAVDGRGGAEKATGFSPADEFRNLLRSRIQCADFLEKLECAQASISESLTKESSSWDMVNGNDLWDGGNNDLEDEDYLLVSQEDVVDGIASYMAAYLLSLKETKDLTPDQIQDALSKTFSVKKKKGIIRKAWDGSKVIYNIASWGATAIGIYQNPAIVSAASAAFWSSCGVISKLF